MNMSSLELLAIKGPLTTEQWEACLEPGELELHTSYNFLRGLLTGLSGLSRAQNIDRCWRELQGKLGHPDVLSRIKTARKARAETLVNRLVSAYKFPNEWYWGTLQKALKAGKGKPVSWRGL